ncbi:hypothetical protein TNIN_121411 [Trichonephila inaurata madagascariensis]|uniref:Uncharacterized protein n=1 Tax=Trichonephila inaurata madagascariensis TaxID=2747483 RepID=A0A8X7C2C7_9ARAC|nr:hypothetical protein TNIN_121411 [Trichonephila inaurata madagascariensis]
MKTNWEKFTQNLNVPDNFTLPEAKTTDDIDKQVAAFTERLHKAYINASKPLKNNDTFYISRINSIYLATDPRRGVAQGTLISPSSLTFTLSDIRLRQHNLCMFGAQQFWLTYEPTLIARALNKHLIDLEDWFSKWKIHLMLQKRRQSSLL